MLAIGIQAFWLSAEILSVTIIFKLLGLEKQGVCLNLRLLFKQHQYKTFSREEAHGWCVRQR